MKLVIEVKEEDYKRYKEDKICSYASAVLDAVPLNEVLDKIRDEIEEQVLESLSDGGDDWFVAEKVNECLDIIDKYGREQE